MNSQDRIACSLLSLGTCLVFMTGCAGVKNPSGTNVTVLRSDEAGQINGIGIESQDLVVVTEKMARGLVGVPELSTWSSPPRIFTDPVLNETRFRINTDMFLTRIRTGLNSNCQGKFRFLARDRMAVLEEERRKKRVGEVTANSDPNVQEFKGGDYLLTGKIQGLTTRTTKGTSDYVLYGFQLIDARTTEIVWEGNHEIKKQGKEDAVYQ